MGFKALLDDFDSLDRWIQISNLKMTPSQSIVDMLDIEFLINYYGIEKLRPYDNPI